MNRQDKVEYVLYGATVAYILKEVRRKVVRAWIHPIRTKERLKKEYRESKAGQELVRLGHTRKLEEVFREIDELEALNSRGEATGACAWDASKFTLKGALRKTVVDLRQSFLDPALHTEYRMTNQALEEVRELMLCTICKDKASMDDDAITQWESGEDCTQEEVVQLLDEVLVLHMEDLVVGYHERFTEEGAHHDDLG